MGNGDIVVEWGGDQTRLKGLVLISIFEADGPMGSSSYFSVQARKTTNANFDLCQKRNVGALCEKDKLVGW